MLEQLQTFSVQIESILNCRPPLTPISNDPNDLAFLFFIIFYKNTFLRSISDKQYNLEAPVVAFSTENPTH